MVSLPPTMDVSFFSTVTAWSVLASTNFKKETMSPLKQKTPIKGRRPVMSSVSERVGPGDEDALRLPRGSGLLPCLWQPLRRVALFVISRKEHARFTDRSYGSNR